MKKTLLAILSLLAAAPVLAAEPLTITRVLKDTTTTLSIPLTTDSVFCTDRGYGNIQLKVSVADLDWLAHFDHRVVGEGLPCITGGRCTADMKPEKIIDPKERLAVAPIRVILSEKLIIDREAKTCHRVLEETIKSHIRGVNFSHYRSSDEFVAVDYEKCLKDSAL